MAQYKHVNGAVWDIDLDAQTDNMRAHYEGQIAKGELIPVEEAPKAPAKKAAASSSAE